MKAVLDTNVLISAYLSSRGAPAEMLRRWRSGEFTLVLSALIILEFERVLRRPKFRAYLDPGALPLDELRAQAEIVLPVDVMAVLDDPSDDVIVGTALAGGADVIISGDDHLLRLDIYRGIKILTPRQFRDVLEMARSDLVN